MPDAIIVTLDPPRASVKPGQEAMIGVTVHNDSDEVETYELSLEGPAEVLGWLELQPTERTVSAFPMQDAQAKVIVRPPTGTPGAPYFFSVRATSRSSSSVQAVVRLNFDVDAPPPVAAPPVAAPPIDTPTIHPMTIPSTPPTASATPPSGPSSTAAPDLRTGPAIEVVAEEVADPSLRPTAGRWRLRVRNAGLSAGTFGFSVLDVSPRMVSVEPPEMKLDPGEAATARLTVRLGDETGEGTRSLAVRTYAFGDPERQSETPLALLVRRSNGPTPAEDVGLISVEGQLAVSVDQDRFAVEPGTTRRAKFLLENLGTQPMTFDLQAAGAPASWFSPESTSATVAPGRIVPVEVVFSAPEGSPGGAYPLSIRGVAGQNAASFQASLLLQVDAGPPAWPISLSVKGDSSTGDDRLRTAPGSPVRATVTVKNSTSLPANVELQVLGVPPSWVKIDREAVMIFGNRAEPIHLSITPPDDLEEGRAGVYPILIKGKSPQLPDQVGDARTELEVQVLGEHQITLGENATPSVRKGSYPLLVRNQTNAPVQLEFSGSDSGDALLYLFDPPALTARPGEEKPVNLTIRARQLTAQARTIEFKVIASGEYTLAGGSHQDAGGRELSARYSQLVAPAVTLTLSPRSIDGADRGEYQVRLKNPDGAPLTVRLTANDEAQGLNFEFSPVEVTLAAGEDRVTKLVVRTKERPKPGQARDFIFSVTASPAPGYEARPASDQATLKILRPHWWEGPVATLKAIGGWLAAIIRFLRERSRWKYLLAALVCLAVVAFALWLYQRVARGGVAEVPVVGPIVAAAQTRVAQPVIPTPTSSPVSTTVSAPTGAPSPTGAPLPTGAASPTAPAPASAPSPTEVPRPTQAPANDTPLPGASTPVGSNAVPLDSQVSTSFRALPTPASAVFVDLNGPTRVEVNSTTEVPAASTAKLPVLIAVWQQLNDGKLKPTDALTVTKDKIVGGTGILQTQPGRTLSVEELLEVTILNSDNTGANMLIDKIGGLDQVNATLKSLGYTHTHVLRHFLDTEAQKKGLDNTMSPGDMADMLVKIYHGEMISKAASADMHRILLLRGLKTEAVLDFIGRRLIPRPPIAHLNGELNVVSNGVFTGGIRDDGGIVEPPSGAYVIVIFLSKPGNVAAVAAAEDEIATASLEIYQTMTQAR